MKGCLQWNSVYSRKDFRLQQELNLGLLDQQATAYVLLSLSLFFM